MPVQEATLMSTADIMRDFQYGKNGGIEYRWSSHPQERYAQLYYQLTQDHPDSENTITVKRKIISEYQSLLRLAIDRGFKNDKDQLYRLLLHCRDRKEGKGLRSISLHLLCVTCEDDYPGFLDLFKRMVGAHECFMDKDRMGCWRDYRDIQYLLQKDMLITEFVQEEKRKVAAKDIASICIATLIRDVNDINSSRPPSMLGKWFPREKGKFGWLFNQMYKRIKNLPIGDETTIRVMYKSDLRHILSKLNNVLNTLEVKQCSRRWHAIDFSNISHSRITKQVDAFLGKSKSNWSKETKDIDNIDRRLCKKQLLDIFTKNVTKSVSSVSDPNTSSSIPASSLSDDVSNIVRLASTCNEKEDPEMGTLINRLWNIQMDKIKEIWKDSNDKEALFYPMIDVSFSMASELHSSIGSNTKSTAPVFSAIAVGLTLANLSSQSSIVVFGTSAQIIDLTTDPNLKEDIYNMNRMNTPGNNCKYDLCKVVKAILRSPGSGTLSDIVPALDKFYQVYSKLFYTSRNNSGYNRIQENREFLAIISDFQFSPHYRVQVNNNNNNNNNINNNNNNNNNNTSSVSQLKTIDTINSTIPVSTIVNEYLCSIDCVTTPYTIFWNTSCTSGFPGLSFYEKTIFMSGANPCDIISAISPIKKSSESRLKGGSRINHYSIDRNNSHLPVTPRQLSNIDGNNIMWSRTPTHYLYRSLQRNRYMMLNKLI